MFYDTQSAARILKLIRNSDGITITDLYNQLGMPLSDRRDSPLFTLSHGIDKVLRDLLDSRLVIAKIRTGAGCLAELDHDNPSKPDDQIVYLVNESLIQIQTFLGISLSQIARAPSGQSIMSVPLFGPPDDLGDKNELFVIMPFSEEMNPIYEDHIKKVAHKADISCSRADDIFRSGQIMLEVWSRIYHANIIVADCTNRNPNVFYELGISHTVGKKVILIAQSRDDIPFDIAHLRCIIYTYTPRGMKEFEDRLCQALLQNKFDESNSDV